MGRRYFVSKQPTVILNAQQHANPVLRGERGDYVVAAVYDCTATTCSPQIIFT